MLNGACDRCIPVPASIKCSFNKSFITHWASLRLMFSSVMLKTGGVSLGVSHVGLSEVCTILSNSSLAVGSLDLLEELLLLLDGELPLLDSVSKENKGIAVLLDISPLFWLCSCNITREISSHVR